jgi:quercetin dioxygenase-like cupin family protein
MKIYRLEEKDLARFPGGEGEMKVATPIETPRLSAGFATFKRGAALRNWGYWFDEVVYVLQGRARATVSMPPYTSNEVFEVKEGDLYLLPRSCRGTHEALTDDFTALFVALEGQGSEAWGEAKR